VEKTQTKISVQSCPSCGSSRSFKDGLRVLSDGSGAQRFLCRDCGHRFSEKTNKLSPINSSRQLCAVLQEAKKLDTATETKTVVGENKGKLVEFAWRLKKRNLCEQTIAQRTFYLNKFLEKGADLEDPDSVETILATEKFTSSQKYSYVQAYRSYTKIFKIAWDPIKVRYQPKQPFMPTHEEIEALINGSGKKTATFLQVTKDTGARRGEICKIKWIDVNTENKTISINEAEKGSRNRTLRVTDKTLAMIQNMPKTYSPYIFNPNVDAIKRNFQVARDRIARVQQNPRLKQIHLHTFRHFFASDLLKKTKNLPLVRDSLGHKSIINTERYTKTVVFKEEEYYTAVAKTVDEARKLIEEGWTFDVEINGNWIFKKAK
jgi:integrase